MRIKKQLLVLLEFLIKMKDKSNKSTLQNPFDFVVKRLGTSTGKLLYRINPSEKFTNLEIVKYEFKEILQRSADLVLKSRVKNRDYYTHVEYQSSPDKNMLLRMIIYGALIQLTFGVWPTQYIIYMYEVEESISSKIWSYLRNSCLNYRCKSIYLSRMNAEDYIDDSDLGVVVLASVMRFPKGKEAECYRKILTRIVKSDLSERKKYEHYQEISYLSALKPKYSDTLEQVLKTMPIEIDMNKVPFYKEATTIGFNKGLEKGKAEGIAEGVKKGKKESKLEIAMQFYKLKTPLEQIKLACKFSEAEWQIFMEKIKQI